MTYRPIPVVPPRAIPSGSYFTNLPWIGTSTSFNIPINGYAYAAPAVYANDVTIDQMVIQVGTGFAGSVARVGIYSDTGDGFPASLITEFTAATPVDCSTSGQKSITASYTFRAGVCYWWATTASSTGPTFSTGTTPGWPPIIRSLAEATAPQNRYAYE